MCLCLCGNGVDPIRDVLCPLLNVSSLRPFVVTSQRMQFPNSVLCMLNDTVCEGSLIVSHKTFRAMFPACTRIGARNLTRLFFAH